MAARIALRSGAAAPLSAVTTGRSAAGGVHDRAYLDAAVRRRAQLGDFDRVVEVAGFDQVEAAERFLGLGERTVGHHVVPDRRRRRRRLERVAAQDLAALLAHLPGEPAVR